VLSLVVKVNVLDVGQPTISTVGSTTAFVQVETEESATS
jgi:hypothetical protein